MIKWSGTVSSNGATYSTFTEFYEKVKYNQEFDFTLIPKVQSSQGTEGNSSKVVYDIEVKSYMTKPASEGFDFMEKWNNNIPMPLRMMTGVILKETKGMYYMDLHGELKSGKHLYCMRCGRSITNSVSQWFGMGPECGNHGYVNPFDSEEELKQAINKYRNEIAKITWKGWVIKSAITKMEECG